MSSRHYYEGLDEHDKLKMELTLRDLAFRVANMNHGAHRFLSHLVDARRARLAERIACYRSNPDTIDIAESVERRGDPLADAIEKLFQYDIWP